MVHISEDQIKADFIKAMGDELGELHFALWKYTALLFQRWTQFRDLFCVKRERIDLLNRAAPHFFGTTEDALYEAIVLQIARMFDPAKTKVSKTVNKNLSLAAIEKIETDPVVAQAIREAKAKEHIIRELRNKVLAHNDLDVALGRAPRPAAPDCKPLQEVLDAVAAVLNAVSARHGQAKATWNDFVDALGGVPSLLTVLDDGVRAKDERMRRIEEGTFAEEDMKPRDL